MPPDEGAPPWTDGVIPAGAPDGIVTPRVHDETRGARPFGLAGDGGGP